MEQQHCILALPSAPAPVLSAGLLSAVSQLRHLPNSTTIAGVFPQAPAMDADISKPLLAVAALFLAFLGAEAAAALLTCSAGSCCFTVTP